MKIKFVDMTNNSNLADIELTQYHGILPRIGELYTFDGNKQFKVASVIHFHGSEIVISLEGVRNRDLKEHLGIDEVYTTLGLEKKDKAILAYLLGITDIIKLEMIGNNKLNLISRKQLEDVYGRIKTIMQASEALKMDKSNLMRLIDKLNIKTFKMRGENGRKITAITLTDFGKIEEYRRLGNKTFSLRESLDKL